MALVFSADVLLCDKFRFDRHLGRLCERNGGASVAIGSRALDVLGALIEQPGRLASKDEIMNAVWPGLAVEESNLTVQISALRRILDAGASNGSCIQTVPGRGYRFVGTVSPAEPAPDPAAPDLTIRDGADVGSRAGAIIPPPSYPATLPSVPMSRWPRARQRVAIISSLAGIAVLLLAAYLLAGTGIAVLLLAVFLLAGAGSVLFRTPESRWVGRGGEPPLPMSIIVLPFIDLSAAHNQQYFADALTEDVTADISRLSGTFVISSNTAFVYRDRRVDTRKLGQELDVRYVLTGSLRREGGQARVTVQLIDTETDAHLWAERFDSNNGNLLVLQNEITARIGNTLGVELIRAAAARLSADRSDAQEYILRGRAVISKGSSRANYAEAIRLIEHALVLNPHSSYARIRLASLLAGRALDELTDTADADVARADGLVGQAMSASVIDGYVRHVKGQILRAQGRFAEAILEYEAALALDPNSSASLSTLGRCKMRLGLLAEAIPLYEQAIRLSPRDPNISVFYFRTGELYLLRGHIDEAIGCFERSRSANPSLPYSRLYLASAYALQGQRESAAAELAEARRLKGDDSYSSIARIARARALGVPELGALYEATYFAGLRAAGVPDQ